MDESESDVFEYDLDESENDVLEFIDLAAPKLIVGELEQCVMPLWRRTVARICGCLAVISAVATIWMMGEVIVEEYLSEEKMAAIRKEQQGNLTAKKEQGMQNAAEAVQETLKNPYANAFAQNEDMVAWLVVEDTVIDYPIMQTMEDENYYLRRDFYGNKDRSGSLILDTDSSLEDAALTSNLIIHGHNMKIGTMFGNLDAYKDETYYQKHKYMELFLEEEQRQYEVIAVFYSQIYYVTDQVFKYYNFFHANTEDEFQSFYENIKELSLYDTGMTAELGDHFLTLSTCDSHGQDGRFVVVAKEIGRYGIINCIE